MLYFFFTFYFTVNGTQLCETITAHKLSEAEKEFREKHGNVKIDYHEIEA